ncbi:Splicing factor [Entomortierella beljakovae]|nr:Splicing factor [Entomortierella beljakovae]
MGNKDQLSDSEGDFELDDIDDSNDVTSPETLELISTLKKSLEENPTQYEQHIQLIALLKGAELIEELRVARESMSRIFPLSEELWMNWIEDESNMATSEEEKKEVLALYERATSDYLSIRIWKSYLDYAIQEYTESVGLPDSEIVVNKEYLDSLFQKANTYTGQHVAQSHIIWNTWMDFELEQLDSKDNVSSDDVKRIKEMYQARIAVPHSLLESTFSDLSSFISKYDGQNYEDAMVSSNKIASATRNVLAKLEPFEEQLNTSGNSLEAFTSYLEYEQKYLKDRFARVKTLFERALTVHCLVPSLWNDYLSFFMSWETYAKPHEEIKGILARALETLASIPNPQELSKVLLASCSYTFRRLRKEGIDGVYGMKEARETFEHALSILDAAGGDPYCRLERLWIELELTEHGDPEKARSLWKLIENKQKSLSDFWISWADMEKGLKNEKGARQVYTRACNSAETLDWPEKVFESWLLFERCFGTLQNYKDAVMRTRSSMKVVEAFRAQNAQQSYATQAVYDTAQPVEYTEVVVEAPKDKSKKRKLSTQEDGGTVKISKTEDSNQVAPKPLNISAGYHADTCFVTNFTKDMTEKKLKEIFQEYGTVLRCTIPSSKVEGKRLFAYVQLSSTEEAQAALALDGRDVGDRRGLSVQISDNTNKKARGTGKPPLPQVSRHELHIRGLSNEVKEEELRKLLSLFAEPNDIYIKRGGSAESGGPWANIKFKSESDANAALGVNGTVFQGLELIASRRIFTKAESSQNNFSEEAPLTRVARRKLAARARAQDSSNQDTHESAPPATASVTESSAITQDVKDEGKKEDSSTPAETNKPPVSKPIMQPRSMQPRSLQSRGGLRARPTRTFPSTRTFVPATSSVAAATSTTESKGEESSSTTDAEPVAKKSNAEFRAMMLSGALKRKNP